MIVYKCTKSLFRLQIYYSVVGRLNTEKEKQINHGATYSADLEGLEAFVTYEFQVLAYTRIGNGPRSSPVRATTLESSKLNDFLFYQLNLFYRLLSTSYFRKLVY